MARRTVTARSRSASPIEAVWERLADGATWKDWAWFPSSSLEREGVPAPDGVGAIRRFGVGPIGSREEVVAFEPPTHLAYVLLSGLPLRDYRSEVTLTPTDDGGTDIEWVSSFDSPSWAAGFWAAFIQRRSPASPRAWPGPPPAERRNRSGAGQASPRCFAWRRSSTSSASRARSRASGWWSVSSRRTRRSSKVIASAAATARSELVMDWGYPMSRRAHMTRW